PAAWRVGARHRPHRPAVGRHQQSSRGHRLSAEPAGAGPDDAGAGAGAGGTAEGAAPQIGVAAAERSQAIIPSVSFLAAAAALAAALAASPTRAGAQIAPHRAPYAMTLPAVRHDP